MAQETELIVMDILKRNGTIIFYLIQILFILMYLDTEIQPFVYVRF